VLRLEFQEELRTRRANGEYMGGMPTARERTFALRYTLALYVAALLPDSPRLQAATAVFSTGENPSSLNH